MIKDYLDEKLHEECGVFGVYRRDADLDVVGTTYYGLYALQHRGQESCGMAVNDDGVFYKRRELGLVNDVFTKDVLETMPRGNMCIGHCRYATTGVPVRSNAQPFVIRHIKGPMALAHNGNLTNSAELRSEFELSGAIFHSTSDTEVIAYAITRERLSSDSIEQAVEQTMDRLKGAYSLVVMSPRKLIAARDPQGFRPLCIGKLGENDIIASESCAITAAGGEFVRDVEPGEIVVFDENGCRSIRTHCGCPTGLCVFEYVYIARPDSVVDGVGTKLKIAFLMDKHDTVGIDCVAMCVNDVITCGAKPLVFLDYIACGKNYPEKIASIVAGVAEGCVQAGAALVGGETAEMPGFYPEQEYDLAGFTVGVVEKSKIIDNTKMQAGDAVIALPSSGVHSNGFSLVRKIFNVEYADIWQHYDELSGTLGETLLTPTKIYVKPVLALMEQVDVRAVSHITGGGFYENIPRALAAGCVAKLEKKSLRMPPIFPLLQKVGKIPERDMFNTFNMGVGMAVVVPGDRADESVRILKEAGEDAYILGEIAKGAEKGVELC